MSIQVETQKKNKIGDRIKISETKTKLNTAYAWFSYVFHKIYN